MELPTHTAPTHESGPPHSDLGDEMANRQPFKVCADTWQVSQLAAAPPVGCIFPTSAAWPRLARVSNDHDFVALIMLVGFSGWRP